jgi:hypothetical protein
MSKDWIMLGYLTTFTTSCEAANVWVTVGDKLEKT